MVDGDGWPAAYGSGRPVDVWCPSTADWAHGFVVESTTAGGIRVRRVSDGVVLPAVFDPANVRAADVTHLSRPRPRR
jgi:hypothetical protein